MCTYTHTYILEMYISMLFCYALHPARVRHKKKHTQNPLICQITIKVRRGAAAATEWQEVVADWAGKNKYKFMAFL